MSGHTPGPWLQSGWRVIGDCGVVAECDTPYAPVEDRSSNARLIAAAPDLLAMLTELLEHLDANPYRCRREQRVVFTERIRGVLAKAEGR